MRGVRFFLYVFVVLLAPNLAAYSAHAQKTTDDHTEEDEPLPPIEAKEFELRVVKRSNTNQLYLFEDLTRQDHIPGRIILLKIKSEPFLALRILKTDRDKNWVTAKKIKLYAEQTILPDQARFFGIEKISDIYPKSPTPDLENPTEPGKEELKPLAYDPELDSPTSPKPKKPMPEEEEDSMEAFTKEPEDLPILGEEHHTLDPYRNWLSVGFGYVRNNNPTGGSSYFSSGQFHYAYNLAEQILAKKSKLQDSLSIEPGLFIYKALNFVTQGDSYSILGVGLNLRYNLILSESFGVFFYGGVIRNIIASSAQASSTGQSALNSLTPAVGGGFYFQIGPSWLTRIDLGYDVISFGLMLRF